MKYSERCSVCKIKKLIRSKLKMQIENNNAYCSESASVPEIETWELLFDVDWRCYVNTNTKQYVILINHFTKQQIYGSLPDDAIIKTLHNDVLTWQSIDSFEIFSQFEFERWYKFSKMV